MKQTELGGYKRSFNGYYEGGGRIYGVKGKGGKALGLRYTAPVSMLKPHILIKLARKSKTESYRLDRTMNRRMKNNLLTFLFNFLNGS